jgi:hypothetical protein
LGRLSLDKPLAHSEGRSGAPDVGLQRRCQQLHLFFTTDLRAGLPKPSSAFRDGLYGGLPSFHNIAPMFNELVTCANYIIIITTIYDYAYVQTVFRTNEKHSCGLLDASRRLSLLTFQAVICDLGDLSGQYLTTSEANQT